MDILVLSLDSSWRDAEALDRYAEDGLIYLDGLAAIDIVHDNHSLLKGGLLLPLIGTALGLMGASTTLLAAEAFATVPLGDTATELSLYAATPGQLRVMWISRGQNIQQITCAPREFHEGVVELASRCSALVYDWAPLLREAPHVRDALDQLSAFAAGNV